MLAARAVAASVAAFMALSACAAPEQSAPGAAARNGPCAIPAEARTPERVSRVVGIAGNRPDRIVDRADLIDEATARLLTARATALEAATTDQLVVVTLPSLDGLSIEQFGMALGNHWGVGRADADNGVLILVAPTERRVRIEVGCGLEALLTDERATEIVRQMVEAFREGDYAGGLDRGTQAIDQILRTRPERPFVS